MDKLYHIFEMQRTLDAEITAGRNLHHWQMQDWIKHQALAIIVELGEVLDEVNYKWWKNPKPLVKEAIAEELADILHFFVGMCLTAGVSADELYQAYLAKNNENLKRQRGLSGKPGYAPLDSKTD